MKIAIIATFLGQKTSGAEISSFLLAKSLSEKEEVFVITSKITHKMPFKCYSLPRLKYLPNMVLLIGHRIIDAYMKKEIYKIFKREKPDIVHIQDPAIMIAAAKAARKLNIPTITTVRDYRFVCNLSTPLEKGIVPFYYSKKQYLEWLRLSLKQTYRKSWLCYFLFNWFYNQNIRLIRNFRKVDYYITVSEFVKKQMVAAGINAERIKTIKVQKEDWSATKKEKNQKNIIFSAGGLKPTKGFDYLIKSFKLVADQHPNVILRIAGDGSARKKLEKLVQKLELSDKVFFLGNISHDKMQKEYAHADFVVSPSLWPEPLTRIIFEAFSMKRTVIATNVGGSRELVIQNKTGLLVEPLNEEKMAEAVIKMIKLPSFREKLAKNAFALINRESGKARVLNKHLKLYQSLIQDKAVLHH